MLEIDEKILQRNLKTSFIFVLHYSKHTIHRQKEKKQKYTIPKFRCPKKIDSYWKKKCDTTFVQTQMADCGF